MTGQEISSTNALNKTTQYIYAGGDLVQMIDPLNRMVDFNTDGIGRTNGITDGLNNSTNTTIDALDHPTQTIDALNQKIINSYDPNGNLKQVIDPKNNTHGYSYDARNYPNGYTDPLNKTESYAYDGNHNLTQKTDRKGQITNYSYDNLDRLTNIIFSGGETITINYDAGNRITNMVNSLTGSLSYSYDGLDNITSVTSPTGVINYTYYPNHLRKTMTIVGQPTITYTYDAGNRLTSMVQAAGAMNNNLAQTTSFTYDVINRRSKTTLPNGITMNYTYDDANQLTSIIYKKAGTTVIGDLSYSYDAAGHRTNIAGTLASSNLPTAMTGTSFDAANRLIAMNGKTLSYDANGNLLGDGTNTYVWNTHDQLLQIKDSTGTITSSYTYDATGRRLSKTIGTGTNSTTTQYLYDGLNIVQEKVAGNITATYLTGGVDEIYAQETGTGSTAQINSYLTDALGSTLQITDKTAVKKVGYSYDPYGNSTADASFSNAFQYTGRENDGTGLYYYRARYYSPTLHRFISSDPIGLNGGINTFAYVDNDPIDFTDPNGETKKYQKPPNPNKNPPPPHRTPTGERERNVGHPDGEEHSRVPKGNNGSRGPRGGQRGFITGGMCSELALGVMLLTTPSNVGQSCPSSEDCQEVTVLDK